MDKEQLRRKLRKRLLEISGEQKSIKSKKACQNLVSTPQFQCASAIMMYLPLPDEVDISDAILCAWQLGKTVVVPKISLQQKHMIPVQINSLEMSFPAEAAGLRNPVAGVPVPFGKIDLIVTPALGFDRKGNRLGRGGSYYDKFFAHKEIRAQRCGFAFTEQLVDSVPVTDHDEPIDFLVTDENIIYFNNQKGN